jgi:uncharacterized membrane protein
MSASSFLNKAKRSFLTDPRPVAVAAAAARAAVAQPERLFLALAIPFGIIFIFLSAPFQAPDEHAHFFRAYAVSTGTLTGAQAILPAAVLDFSETVSKDLPGNDQNKQSKKALVREFSRPFEEQPQVETSFVNSAIVSPVPYLPQALGVLIGRLAHLNPIFIFYLGRITNFLAWLGLTFLAIRITPIHPRLFVALALIPMTLHQAASNSPDAATIAVSFLFIAFALRIMLDQRPTIQWSDWAWISLLIIAVALCKSVYILSAGLLVAVPLRRFRQQRATLPMSLAVMGVGLACGLAWLQYSSQAVSVEMMSKYALPSTEGLGFILQHPQMAAPIFWRSVTPHIDYELTTFVGVLGWLDTILPGWIYPLYYTLLLFTVIFEPHSPVCFYLRERLWIALLAILSILVVMAMFFYPEVSIANGVMAIPQGRYYLPFGTLFFLPLSQQKWSLSRRSLAWVVVALLHGLVLIASVRAMLWRYYAI